MISFRNKALWSANKDKGFSLVEVMVALAILSILAVAFIQLMGWSFTSIFYEGEKSKAIASAKEKQEELAAMGNLEDINLSDPEYVSSGNLLVYNETVPLKRRFYYFADTRPIEDEEVDGYEIAVVVFYGEGKFHVKITNFIWKD
jgi:prepilin-type N-terminal cleavage/methylation domain-containing protein